VISPRVAWRTVSISCGEECCPRQNASRRASRALSRSRRGRSWKSPEPGQLPTASPPRWTGPARSVRPAPSAVGGEGIDADDGKAAVVLACARRASSRPGYAPVGSRSPWRPSTPPRSLIRRARRGPPLDQVGELLDDEAALERVLVESEPPLLVDDQSGWPALAAPTHRSAW
jgi:hypothetical protein